MALSTSSIFDLRSLSSRDATWTIVARAGHSTRNQHCSSSTCSVCVGYPINPRMFTTQCSPARGKSTRHWPCFQSVSYRSRRSCDFRTSQQVFKEQSLAEQTRQHQPPCPKSVDVLTCHSEQGYYGTRMTHFQSTGRRVTDLAVEVLRLVQVVHWKGQVEWGQTAGRRYVWSVCLRR